MIRQLYNYYISPQKHFAREVSNILGFKPSRLKLYKMAFYHRSLNNLAEQSKSYNNERLEYLGDSILNSIVAEYLFKKYPKKDEGFLTKMRSKIVKRKTLNNLAMEMGLDLVLSQYSIGKLSNSMMGNALEAVIGAIYLESGYEYTKQYVIHKLLRRYLDIHHLESYDDNFKSQLLEFCQKRGNKVEFRLISKYKSEKRDRFKVGIHVDGKEIACAEDFNKKAAEQMAANKALLEIKAN